MRSHASPPPITDPLVLRYLEEAQAALGRGEDQAPPILHAWAAVAYQRIAAYSIRYRGYDSGRLAAVSPEAMADLVLAARCVLWPVQETALALEAPLPDHRVGPPEVPEGPALWVFAADLHADSDDGRVSIPAVLIDPYDAGLSVVMLTARGTDDVRLLPMAVPWGARWPEDIPEETRPLLRQVLRLWWFAHSPRVGDEPLADPRPERRRLERAGAPPGSWAATAVHYAGPSAGQHGEGTGGVARHWVAGHYKPQWYPTLEAHRVIWIDPYLRGEGDSDDGPPPSTRIVRRP